MKLSRYFKNRTAFLLLTLSILVLSLLNASASRPNIIMFVVDDMNDWTGPQGNKQAITPNMDRLAKQGVTFLNAHAPGVYCAPSRTAIWTGLYASSTGCYTDEVYHYDYPDIVPMQSAFKKAGYKTYAAGKLYHHRGGYVDLRDWDIYFTRSKEVSESGWEMNGYHQNDNPLPNPHPYSPVFRKTDIEYKKSGHLDFGPLANEDEEKMFDTIRTNWAVDIIKQKHKQPFFLAIGIYAPHFPNYSPQKYFDLYDRDSIEIPLYKKDDLEDLSPEIREKYEKRSKKHKALEKIGALKDTVHGYLAAISYADAMLGRVLDAVETSPYANDTIIVFWGDNGYHIGEKGNWGKHTLWERSSKVPFIWAGKGIAHNMSTDSTVSLIDLYPTFAELCGLPIQNEVEGESLVPILRNPKEAKERAVFIPNLEPHSFAVRNSKWRYLQHPGGSQELYNMKEDPHEWYNLAGNPEYAGLMEELARSAPSEFAPFATPRKDLKLIVTGGTYHWEEK